MTIASLLQALAKRLVNYHAQTVPVLTHYEPTGARVVALTISPQYLISSMF